MNSLDADAIPNRDAGVIGRPVARSAMPCATSARVPSGPTARTTPEKSMPSSAAASSAPRGPVADPAVTGS